MQLNNTHKREKYAHSVFLYFCIHPSRNMLAISRLYDISFAQLAELLGIEPTKVRVNPIYMHTYIYR